MWALIEALAGRLAREGWVLRTGMSPGADQAFCRGAHAADGDVELYLPWPGFEVDARPAGGGGVVRELAQPMVAAYCIGARFHRGWDGRWWPEFGQRERDLLARDAHQVLGRDLHTPAAFVVCWTPEGGLDGSDPRSEGTGQALRIARHHRISVFNLARADHARRWRTLGASG